MPTKFRIESFEPIKLEKANASLDKHFKAAKVHEDTNESYKQTVFKESFWQKVVSLFKS